MDLRTFLRDHKLTQRDVALGSGLALSAVSDIVTGKRNPRTDSVNRLLGYFRQVDPAVTYEQLFGSGLSKAA